MKIAATLALALLTVGLEPISAAVINLNTGAFGSAWQVTQTSGTDNGLGIGTTAGAVVLTGTLPFAANLPGFEAFAWVNPFGGAVWVGQRATDGNFTNGGSITCGNPCGATAGIYTYTFAFDGAPGGSLILSGFTADNRVQSLTVTQTGGPDLYSCGLGTCAATQASVTPSTGTLNFSALAGRIVTITAVVENFDGPGRNPSGFILAGSASVNDTAPVPEPSTFTMLGVGGLFVAACGSFRKKTE